MITFNKFSNTITDCSAMVDNIFNGDCMDLFKRLPDNSIDVLFTDIPYDSCNRSDNGLRNLDKGNADIITFDLNKFLQECWRVTKSTFIIFCGREQFSIISNWFANKQAQNKGTVRQIIWEKTNPSPMNGQSIYLSGIENAVWFKKRGGTFNAHCKNTVFKYPCGRSKVHPTEKNHDLIKELILDNSNEQDLILDPCIGSGTIGLCAKELNRHYIGFELDEHFYNIAVKRLTETTNERN